MKGTVKWFNPSKGFGMTSSSSVNVFLISNVT